MDCEMGLISRKSGPLPSRFRPSNLLDYFDFFLGNFSRPVPSKEKAMKHRFTTADWKIGRGSVSDLGTLREVQGSVRDSDIE